MRPAAPSFVLIAATGGRFADFGPYVAALNNAGQVAFRAQLPGGASGLYTGDGGAPQALPLPYDDFIGHPDVNDAGAVSFIAPSRAGRPNLSVWNHGLLTLLAGTDGELTALGPLGPVMNQAGHVAFCAHNLAGERGVYAAGLGQITRIAGTGSALRAIHGLPAINNSGAVVLRAEAVDGRQGIFLGTGEALTTILDTSGPYQELGNFPSLNDTGTVALTAFSHAAGAELLIWSRGELRSVLNSKGAFASFRSAMIDLAGNLTFTATPHGGRLGIYRGEDEHAQRILGIGDTCQDSIVSDFALNAVSCNDSGQLALRLRLENGRQLILRVEPSAL